ncbi:MAG: hypothetical protein AABX25_01745, partial [Nanoarchaeota archaeon]
MVSKKTLIIFDTNILIINGGKGYSYGTFEFNKDFIDVKNFINTYNLKDKVTLAVPHLCIEELMKRKRFFYDNESKSLKSKFESFSKLDGAVLSIPPLTPDYERFIMETKQN